MLISRHAASAFGQRAGVPPAVAERMIQQGLVSGWRNLRSCASGAVHVTTIAPAMRLTIGHSASGAVVVITAVPRMPDGSKGRGRKARERKQMAQAFDWWREQKRSLCHDL